MSEWRGTTTWTLQCQCCKEFVDWSVKLHLHDDEAWHKDVSGVCCGPVERVELRSE